jgi:hypothetical protein
MKKFLCCRGSLQRCRSNITASHYVNQYFLLSLFFLVAFIQNNQHFSEQVMEGSIRNAEHANLTEYDPTIEFRIFNADVASRFYEVQVWLSRQLKSLTFHDPVHTIYDPLEYAGGMYYHFVQRYCKTPKAVLILGMNPGPWGMAQTGVCAVLFIWIFSINALK